MPIYPATNTPLSTSQPVTSSAVPPIPVPTHGSGGRFSVLAKTTISVPPLEVLSLIRDTNRWPEWNTFCPRCSVTPRMKEREKIGAEIWNDGKEEDGWLEVGSTAVIDVYMNGDGLIEGRKRSRTTTVIITQIEPLTFTLNPENKSKGEKRGYRIAWKATGWTHWQLHSERVMEFLEVQIEGGVVGTEYTCWETFGGVLAVAVKGTVGNALVDRFGDYARDIKDYLERKKVGGPALGSEGATRVVK